MFKKEAKAVAIDAKIGEKSRGMRIAQLLCSHAMSLPAEALEVRGGL
jgi:hypothetical protein